MRLGGVSRGGCVRTAWAVGHGRYVSPLARRRCRILTRVKLSHVIGAKVTQCDVDGTQFCWGANAVTGLGQKFPHGQG